MEDNFLHRVYNLMNNIIHLNDLKFLSHKVMSGPVGKHCPVTGLDISMQPKNSKFISYIGVKWYFENDLKTFNEVLAWRMHHKESEIDINQQFHEIAHHVRNTDSNPRNNTKRAIMKIVNDKNSLFNNMELIDKKKLKDAGYIK